MHFTLVTMLAFNVSAVNRMNLVDQIWIEKYPDICVLAGKAILMKIENSPNLFCESFLAIIQQYLPLSLFSFMTNMSFEIWNQIVRYKITKEIFIKKDVPK